MTVDYSKFDIEEDTELRYERLESIEGIDVLYQSWVWCGILGHSIIFKTEDVRDLSDHEIKKIVSGSSISKNKNVNDMTISNRTAQNEFVILNFDFRSNSY